MSKDWSDHGPFVSNAIEWNRKYGDSFEDNTNAILRVRDETMSCLDMLASFVPQVEQGLADLEYRIENGSVTEEGLQTCKSVLPRFIEQFNSIQKAQSALRKNQKRALKVYKEMRDYAKKLETSAATGSLVVLAAEAGKQDQFMEPEDEVANAEDKQQVKKARLGG